MSKLENVIKIVSPSEFETLATKVGGDKISRIELINAILDINGLIKGDKRILNPEYKKK
jgi:hypothetical protein